MTRRSRGFGFVEFETPATAAAAIDASNQGQLSLGGRDVRCHAASPIVPFAVAERAARVTDAAAQLDVQVAPEKGGAEQVQRAQERAAARLFIGRIPDAVTDGARHEQGRLARRHYGGAHSSPPYRARRQPTFATTFRSSGRWRTASFRGVGGTRRRRTRATPSCRSRTLPARDACTSGARTRSAGRRLWCRRPCPRAGRRPSRRRGFRSRPTRRTFPHRARMPSRRQRRTRPQLPTAASSPASQRPITGSRCLEHRTPSLATQWALRPAHRGRARANASSWARSGSRPARVRAPGASSAPIPRSRHLRTSAGTIRAFFQGLGPVEDVYVPMDRASGQNRGFAFITFAHAATASAAIAQGTFALDGRWVVVSSAWQRGERAAQGGGGSQQAGGHGPAGAQHAMMAGGAGGASGPMPVAAPMGTVPPGRGVPVSAGAAPPGPMIYSTLGPGQQQVPHNPMPYQHPPQQQQQQQFHAAQAHTHQQQQFHAAQAQEQAQAHAQAQAQAQAAMAQAQQLYGGGRGGTGPASWRGEGP